MHLTDTQREALLNARTYTRAEARPFEVGDRVHVVRRVGGAYGVERLNVGVEGEIVGHNADGDNAEVRRRCWEVCDGEGEYGWHSDEELEHVKES